MAYDVLEACKDGKLEKVETLFAQSFMDIPKLFDMGGKNGLHLAASCNRVKIVEFLCKSKEMLDHQANTGDTPVDYGLTTGNVEVVKVLINNGADFKTLRRGGKNAFFEAVKATNSGFNDPGACITLIATKGIDINHKETFFGQTPLHVAVHHGDLKIVKLLVSLGANPNVQDCLGKTATHYAKEMKLEEMYEFLFPKTDLTIRDILGNSAKKTSKPLYGLNHFPYSVIYCADQVKPVYEKCKGLLKTSDSATHCMIGKYPVADTKDTIALFKQVFHQFDVSFFFSHVACMNLIHGFSYMDGIFYTVHPSSFALDHVKAKTFGGKIDLALKLTKSLEFIHNQGIVCRNLCMANACAIQHMGGGGVTFSYGDVGTVLPKLCHPVETPFDAPEVTLHEHYSQKADIYALAAILFELIFDAPMQVHIKMEMTEAFADCVKGLLSLFTAMRSGEPEDRPTIREVHDGLVHAKLEFILKGLQNGEFKHTCSCPKVHKFEELQKLYSYQSAKIMDENERNQKRFLYRDERQLQVVAEGVTEFVYSKWNDFLEKHLKKGYLDSTQKELSNKDIEILHNMKKFIFEEPTNSLLFTVDSVILLEKIVMEMKDIFTCLDLLRFLVLNPISVELLIHTQNKIFAKIFSTVWKDQKKNTKIFVLRLFVNLLGKDTDAIWFCQDNTKLNKIVTFACLGLLDQERDALLKPSIALCLNLMCLSPYLVQDGNSKIWDNLISTVMKVMADLPEDKYKSEKTSLALIMYRFLHGYEERIKKTRDTLRTLENWMIGGNLIEAVIELYRYEEYSNSKNTEAEE
jgi:hypothetical protein